MLGHYCCKTAEIRHRLIFHQTSQGTLMIDSVKDSQSNTSPAAQLVTLHVRLEQTFAC